MDKSVRNPTRRNRNIGTSKQGHGMDNNLVIPKAWPDDRVFWEVLKNPVAVKRNIGESEITFLVEATRPECFYPCSIDDIATVLEHVPSEHLDGLDLIILRQPTKKQSVVSSVWGRFLYYAVPGQYSGTAICIEAHDLSEKDVWSKSLTPFDQKELERLANDGHQIRSDRRGHEIVRTADSVRNTVLFRTLLHEVGHYVDWLESVLWPCSKIDDPAEDEQTSQAFDTKPSKEREEFAHKYADQLSAKLRKKGLIPFAPIIQPDSMRTEGVEKSWFVSGPTFQDEPAD